MVSSLELLLHWNTSNVLTKQSKNKSMVKIVSCLSPLYAAMSLSLDIEENSDPCPQNLRGHAFDPTFSWIEKKLYYFPTAFTVRCVSNMHNPCMVKWSYRRKIVEINSKKKATLNLKSLMRQQIAPFNVEGVQGTIFDELFSESNIHSQCKMHDVEQSCNSVP